MKDLGPISITNTGTKQTNNNIIIGNLKTNTINGVKGTDTSNSNPNPKLSHATII